MFAVFAGGLSVYIAGTLRNVHVIGADVMCDQSH